MHRRGWNDPGPLVHTGSACTHNIFACVFAGIPSSTPDTLVTDRLGEAVAQWTVEYEVQFERFLLGLGECEQAVLDAGIRHVLAERGMDICAGEWGKPLSDGLYGFRVRGSLQPFCPRPARLSPST